MSALFSIAYCAVGFCPSAYSTQGVLKETISQILNGLLIDFADSSQRTSVGVWRAAIRLPAFKCDSTVLTNGSQWQGTRFAGSALSTVYKQLDSTLRSACQSDNRPHESLVRESGSRLRNTSHEWLNPPESRMSTCRT